MIQAATGTLGAIKLESYPSDLEYVARIYVKSGMARIYVKIIRNINEQQEG